MLFMPKIFRRVVWKCCLTSSPHWPGFPHHCLMAAALSQVSSDFHFAYSGSVFCPDQVPPSHGHHLAWASFSFPVAFWFLTHQPSYALFRHLFLLLPHSLWVVLTWPRALNNTYLLVIPEFTASAQTVPLNSRLLYPTAYSTFPHSCFTSLSNAICPRMNSSLLPLQAIALLYSLSQ